MDTSAQRSKLTGFGCVLTLAVVSGAFVAQRIFHLDAEAAWLLTLALIVSIWWQRNIELDGITVQEPPAPSTWPRRIVGAGIAIGGAALWASGSYALSQDWRSNFDQAWINWFAGTVLLSFGFDLLWARWTVADRSRRWIVWASAIVIIGALFRLGTFYIFPAPYSVTQVEELQVGAMGADVLAGGRLRWEFLSQAWLGALGLKLGGPTLLSTRLPSTIISFLKILPFFLWMRFTVGDAGAIVGSLLLAISGWDTTFARVSTNHDVIVVTTAFALLTGPAQRGRPSAYIWLGFLSGYVMFEYVLYRPLAVFALGGALVVSVRNQRDHWLKRVSNPLLAVVIFLAMAVPLGLYITRSGRTREFFDGIGRATANHAYYNPDDSWGQALAKRAGRAGAAVVLLYFHGPDSPVSNPWGVPLADPFTGALLVVGAGYCLAHPLRRLFGLTLAATLLTLASALVITGNFDFVRAGSAVGYIFALAGFGAASVARALRELWPRWGKQLAVAVLGAGTLYAAAFSVQYLTRFLTAPEIRRAQFRDLAYLSWWLKQNVRDGERAEVVAPNFTYLMEVHDASWMRPPSIQGHASWDLQSALLDWTTHRVPTVFMIYSGATSDDVRNYLNWLLPGLTITLERGPIGAEKDLLAVHSATLPEKLGERLANWGCQPVQIEVELLAEDGRVLDTIRSVAGIIDPVEWPQAAQRALNHVREEVKQARAHFSADFEVKAEGDYVFSFETFPGLGVMMIDDTTVPNGLGGYLAPGKHRVDLRSEYDPIAAAPHFRLYWEGPDSGGRRELLPFYRFGPERCGRRPSLQAKGAEADNDTED